MAEKDAIVPCQHYNSRIFRTNPPHTKCLDCGELVATPEWCLDSIKRLDAEKDV